MKVITIKQPYAQLICERIKTIENRSWKTSFRGRVLIHTSAKPNRYPLDMVFTEKQLDEMLKNNTENYWCGHEYFGAKYYDSAIIGSVEIVDCVKDHPSVWAEKGVWNWILDNAVLFPEPILKVSGKLSFWDYPNIIAEPDEYGVLTCNCMLPVKEENQVTRYGRYDFTCRYCGSKWHK
jgi:hypothetical protein